MTSEPPSLNPSTGPAPNPWGDRDWSTYYAAVAGKAPRDTLLLALDLWERGGSRASGSKAALDLGAGEGRDTRELLGRGFKVLALDPHPDAAKLIAEGVRADQEPALTIVKGGTESLASVLAMRPEFGAADVVNASFSLPFIPPPKFDRAWRAIRGAIAPGGVFAGQFFGPQDSWASIPGRSHHTCEQVERMLDGLVIGHFDESNKPGHDAEGNAKHWHVFHVVAKRPI